MIKTFVLGDVEYTVHKDEQWIKIVEHDPISRPSRFVFTHAEWARFKEKVDEN